jgi:plastocyanin
MKRQISFLFVALTVALAVGGCGRAPGAASTTSTTTSSTMPSPTSARVSPLTGTPVPVPLATLSARTQDASQAPAGAIPIRMIILPSAAPRFEPNEITVKSGTVVFFLENIPNPPFESDHNMLIGRAIPQALAGTPAIKPDQKVTFTVNDLTPGVYLYWCSIRDVADRTDHAGEGMVGTLTVTP